MNTKLLALGAVGLGGVYLLMSGTSDDGRFSSGSGSSESATSRVSDALGAAGVTLNIEAPVFPDNFTQDYDMSSKKIPNASSLSQYIPQGGPEVTQFKKLKSEGNLVTVGESGDLMTAKDFDISNYKSTTKSLPKKQVVEAASKFTLPFVGETGASSFSDYLKTHNIWGKKTSNTTVDSSGFGGFW